MTCLLLQEFGFSDQGELQFEEDLCLDLSSTNTGAHIHIQSCHGLGGNQKWIYNNQVCNVIKLVVVAVSWEDTCASCRHM